MKLIFEIIKKEFRQFKRDPKMFAMVLVAPVIQLVFLGYAANLDVENIHMLVFDQSNSKTSREVVRKFDQSDYFSLDFKVNTYNEVEEIIDAGKVSLALIIDRDFEVDLANNRPGKIQAIFDGSDGNSASIASGYMNGLLTEYSQNISVENRLKSGQKFSISSVVPKVRVWYNPELKTRNYMVPGIVGLLLMIITLILTSLAIVKEKEIGTMEQLIVTPISSTQLIIGKLVPFMILGFASVIIVLTAMYLFFGIQVRGSISLLLGSTFIYILSTLGLGLFVSTISKTQQQAMMLAIFVVMLPMTFLSGFAFPIENMPQSIQWITHIIPLKYFMTIIRGIVLKGIGFAELWKDILLMLLIGVSILGISALRFQKKLD
ncbi:MAG: ABC transporter permease [Melioribacteraceae bacterium]|nr:ABC transporter permease [Melioribacteraceae bacterium]MCF8262924.1 ABC transporter permease [Melioribacteraceae bacterium]MCF8431089.1 ABC transporter permease [Melioribacteraceae bacterium]